MEISRIVWNPENLHYQLAEDSNLSSVEPPRPFGVLNKGYPVRQTNKKSREELVQQPLQRLALGRSELLLLP